MKTTNPRLAIISVALSSAVLIPLAGQAQQLLLNIGDSTYPTPASAQNYISDAGLFGYNNTGISLSDAASTFAPGYGQGGITTGTFSGGQTIALSYAVGAWAKPMPTPTPTQPDGLSDLYLYNNSSPSTPCTVSLGDLSLSASSTYTLYVYGWINGGNENSMLQPLNNNADIVYDSTTATTDGFLAVQFSTTASYVNSDTLDFTWANQTGNSGDGVLNGFAIVPAPEPSSMALSGIGGLALLLIRQRARR
jgi:hypothetical protein